MPVDQKIVREAALDLLAAREAGATVCPSEVARASTAGVEAASWRDAMPIVHDVVDQLIADGLIQRSWKGKPLASRAGPYRIARVGQ